MYKIGDEVTHRLYPDWFGIVISINDSLSRPIRVRWNSSYSQEYTYTIQGKQLDDIVRLRKASKLERALK